MPLTEKVGIGVPGVMKLEIMQLILLMLPVVRAEIHGIPDVNAQGS